MSERKKPRGGSVKKPGPRPLTDRRKRFVQEYKADPNKKAAAKRAGYAYPEVMGSRLMKVKEIKDEIKAEQIKVAERLGITAERALADLAEMKQLVIDRMREAPGNEILAKLATAFSRLQQLEMKRLGQLRDRVELTVNDWPDLSGLSDEDLKALDLIAEKARKSAGDGGQQPEA
jgi:hypothetical protein